MRNVPIIAVTADAMPQHRDVEFSHGMNEYLTKPLNPAELMATLVKVHAASPSAVAPKEPAPIEPDVQLDAVFDEEVLNSLRQWMDAADLREAFARIPHESAQCTAAIEAAVADANCLAAAGFLDRFLIDEQSRAGPVFVVSWDDSLTTRLRALEAGAMDVLRKPIDSLEFVARVRNALASRARQKGSMSERELGTAAG